MQSRGLQEAGKTLNQSVNDRDPARDDQPERVAEGSNPDLVQTQQGADDDAARKRMDDAEWLARARDAHTTSEDYFDASIRKSAERNLAHFSNRHAPGSKYYSDAYKFRAKGFRPKTRSVVRRNESKAAIALFSTSDVVHVAPENDSDEQQMVSAEINQELVNYRLDNTVPWYMVCMGAYQDANVQGVCISHQFWDYEEIEIEEKITVDGEQVFDNETGEPATGIRREVVKDTPKVELRPIENVRFSPAADWDDPVGTSPYLIDKIPMEVGEIKRRAQQGAKNRVPWRIPSEGRIKSAATTNYDPIRSQRENDRQDSKGQQHATSDFDIVWVHRNIIRKDGKDWLYYTLGVEEMLSDVVPLSEEYPHLRPGERPYVLGVSNIETHKTYPESNVGMVANLQQEANDINNQRRDNVALVLNRRYYVKRDAQVDYRTLKRSVPGGVVEMNDPNTDIKPETTLDVTGSSYQEQDRVNMDFDDLAGAFSNSSVSTNRQLNETVGGMQMMSAGADEITEYQLRTFVQTWVKPVIKQIIRLEQRFETDEAILAMVGEKINSWQKYGLDQITDQMLQGNMTVEVNVGFGATNPQQRIEKLTMGLNTVLNFAPEMQMRLKGDDVAAEVFGALGYDGTKRFFVPEEEVDPQEPQEDPRIAVAKLNAQVKQMEMESRENIEMAKLSANSEWKQREAEVQLMLADLKSQLETMKTQGANADSIRKIKADIAKLMISIRSSERMLGLKASQQPKQPYEPPGRAEPGLSAVQ